MTIGQRVIVVLSILATASTGCYVSWRQDPPGWHSPVSELFVDTSAFPEGWQIDFPEDAVTDPGVNSVGRSWGHPQECGTANQGIWRAHSISRAKRKYSELVKDISQPNTEIHSEDTYIEFQPSEELDYQSQTADEFYLACGLRDVAYCVVFARYRNYVTSMTLKREAEFDNHRSCGLTYPEIEAVIRAMDAKFEQFLASLPS
jgi:hypothetical protein